MKGLVPSLVSMCSIFISCNFSSPGIFDVSSRIYSPDSTKMLVRYSYIQGAWDGGRTSFTTILNAMDSIPSSAIGYSWSSLDFDDIYWKGNDTVILQEKYTDFMSSGKSNLRDTVINNVFVKVVQKDPIDSSYTRKIFYYQTSPDGKYDLAVYRYMKSAYRYYFLNISIIDKGDSIPKYGNFYISKYDFDCFNDIRWDSLSRLDIKVYESCYYAFGEYLVKNRPSVKFTVQINDTIRGNIQLPTY
jgi:hypothetical protein